MIVLEILLIFVALSNCTTIELQNSEWCGDKGALGASCFHTLSDDSRSLLKSDWDKERIGMVCTKAESFGEWKKVLLKLCDETGYCTYKIKSTADQLEKKAIKSVTP